MPCPSGMELNGFHQNILSCLLVYKGHEIYLYSIY